LGEEERALKNGEISDVWNPSSLGKKGTLYSAPPNLPVTHRKTQPGTSGQARNFRPPELPGGPELPGSLWGISAQHSGKPGTWPGICPELLAPGTSGRPGTSGLPLGQICANSLISPELSPEPARNFRPPELPGSPELPASQKTACTQILKHAQLFHTNSDFDDLGLVL
jgi:hypothetical protein